MWDMVERNFLFAKYVIVLVTSSTEHQKIVAETVQQLSFSMSQTYVCLCSFVLISRGAFSEGGPGTLGHVSLLSAEGALLSLSAPGMEKLVSGYCALKKVNQKSSLQVFPRNVNENRPRHRCTVVGNGFTDGHGLERQSVLPITSEKFD